MAYLRVGLILAALWSALPAAQADSTYPPRPVRMLVGFAPGGTTDILARMAAARLSDFFHQQFVVDNRPGATGNIATEIVARAAPDGCTLLVVPASFAANVSLFPKVPYAPLRDFAPVGRIASVHNVLVAHPAVAFKTVPELIAYVRERPGKLTFGSAGSGSTSHLAIELLKTTAGPLNVLHVPYRGLGPAMLDLLANEVDVLFATTPTVLPHVRQNRLRPIAVASLRRAQGLPQVPTFSESGLPGFEAAAWNAVLAPAGTNYDVVTRLNLALVQTFSSADFRERLQALGAEPIAETPDDFRVYLRAEIDKWATVVKRTGARVE